jgi:hypothetical protein
VTIVSPPHPIAGRGVAVVVQGASVLPTRKPTVLSLVASCSLLRPADRRTCGIMYQESPRSTRLPQSPVVQAEPSVALRDSLHSSNRRSTRRRSHGPNGSPKDWQGSRPLARFSMGTRHGSSGPGRTASIRDRASGSRLAQEDTRAGRRHLDRANRIALPGVGCCCRRSPSLSARPSPERCLAHGLHLTRASHRPRWTCHSR